jgi:hypothetical protein
MKRGWLVALLMVFGPLAAQEEKPFVTCYLMGQIGNQLFQVATTLSFAWDHDVKAVFPRLHAPEYRLTRSRDVLFFRVDASFLPRPCTHLFQEEADYIYKPIPFQKDLLLYGYFQSWRYFDHHRSRLLEVFAPSETVESSLKSRYGDLLSLDNTVAVHVRTFNLRLHHTKRHPFLGLDYYAQAMQLFPEDATFVIFSDRIGWCKHYFPKLGKNCVFIEGNSDIEDLFLMSKMKNQIMANSSFSWWAAYLNPHPGKKVVAPVSMMHPDHYPFPMTQPNTLYLPDWILVSPNYNAPYPFDMTWYDRSTTSLDGN